MLAEATDKGVFNCGGLEHTLHVVSDRSGRIMMERRTEHASARNAPTEHARALWIYLKHQGVLNVEEFRRANARGL